MFDPNSFAREGLLNELQIWLSFSDPVCLSVCLSNTLYHEHDNEHVSVSLIE